MTRHLIAALLVSIAGCAAQSANVKATPQDDITALYNHSIYEASVFKPEHILPLKVPADGEVAVVTFTHDQKIALGRTNTGKKTIWITLVPEVQDLCRTWHTDNLILRLEQLIGLPPTSGDTMMEVFTLDSARLQRPCPNPDTKLPSCDNKPADDLSDEYRKFFVDQTLGSYQVPGGYPWTHLGYTYDWNPESKNHYGASEYIVRQDTEINVISFQTAADYCAPVPGH
jgi:hypothetical protein